MISDEARHAFTTLCEAATNGDLCLMEATHNDTGEVRTLLCAVNWPSEPGGETEFIPLAVVEPGMMDNYTPPEPTEH